MQLNNMETLNNIIKEIRNIPLDKLPELYIVIINLKAKSNSSNSSRNKILSYSGCFNELSEKDYRDFKLFTKNTRDSLFN